MTAVNNLCKTSTILNGDIEYVKQVVKGLGCQFQWRLCYRASVHGWSAQNFHTNCGNKGQTVTFVQVGEYIFDISATPIKTGQVSDTQL